MESHPACRPKSRPAIQWRMDSKTVRRQNLQILEHQHRSLAAIERLTQGEVTASYLSQIKGGYRKMGDSVARKIEERAGLPHGWMDQQHAIPQPDLPAQVGSPVNGGKSFVEVTSVIPAPGGSPATYSIPLLEIEASMGGGRVQPEYETIVSKIDLNQHWVRSHLPNVSSPHNLRVITGYGDSMAGTYEDGDPLFVDIGVTEVNVDAVYAFALNRSLYVKRLQRRPDGTLNVISDNPKYPPYAITATEDVRVIGRIVGGWNWRKL